METEKWIVGPESDQDLFRQPGCVLQDLGFILDKKWDGLAGSQEVAQWIVESGQGKLVIEAETYLGLSVEGDRDLVRRVRECLRKRAQD